MTGVYRLVTPGQLPLTTSQARDFLRIDDACDEDLLLGLIRAAVQWGEKYTRRDFRVNRWSLTLDCFPDRILLRRDPVVSLVSITYLDGDDVSAVVPPTDYYLKPGVGTSEVLPTPDGDGWPTDVSDLEGSIVVLFDSGPTRCGDLVLQALRQHVAYLYENRGDCPSTGEAADLSGARALYALVRVPRI